MRETPVKVELGPLPLGKYISAKPGFAPDELGIGEIAECGAHGVPPDLVVLAELELGGEDIHRFEHTGHDELAQVRLYLVIEGQRVIGVDGANVERFNSDRM